jgi:hypothetical protein
MDAIPAAWLRRNVFQPWEDGPYRLVMYRATVDWAKPRSRASAVRRGSAAVGSGTGARAVCGGFPATLFRLSGGFTIPPSPRFSSRLVKRSGLHPNFPPVISRVRRLFRPCWGVSFVVVSCSSQFFRPPFTPLRAVEKLSGFGSEVGARCTAPASSAGQAVRATAELP